MSLDRWDAPNGSYTDSIAAGMNDFRRVTAELFEFAKTEVIRDRSRCNATRSEHCEAGAGDFFTTDLDKGRFVFEMMVAAADPLHIQSVIFNSRVIGFGNPTERHYTGPSPHVDHVHVGLDRYGRAHLTEALCREVFMKIVEDAVRKVLQEEGLVAMDDQGKLTVAQMLTESVDGKLKDGVKVIRDEQRAGFAAVMAALKP